MNKAKLVDLMAEKGLTQSTLASKAHVSRTSISAFFNHGRVPRMDTLGQIARALEVKPSELLDLR